MDDLRLLVRGEWGASPKSLSPYLMKLPAVGVHLHHSVTLFDDDGSYSSTDDVASDMREIERIGLQRFGRYSYSYNGHPSGIIGEGQGNLVGAHTTNYNSTTFGYCFIGNYENDPLTDEQVEAFGIWWRWKVSSGHLLEDAYVKLHRDRKQTACPGQNTVNRLQDLLDARTAKPVEPQPEPEFPQEEDMLIIRRGNPNHRLLQLGGFLYVAHDDLVEIDDATPRIYVGEKMWAKMVAVAQYINRFVDPR